MTAVLSIGIVVLVAFVVAQGLAYRHKSEAILMEASKLLSVANASLRSIGDVKDDVATLRGVTLGLKLALEHAIEENPTVSPMVQAEAQVSRLRTARAYMMEQEEASRRAAEAMRG